MFTNLLINTGQALGEPGEITIRTWAEGGNIFLVFASGCGMPPEISRRILEPFFTTKEVGKGTGLGLSITYDIIKKHRGDIQGTSEKGGNDLYHTPAGGLRGGRKQLLSRRRVSSQPITLSGNARWP